MKIRNHCAYRADDRNGKPFVIRREGDSVWVGVTEPVFETVHWSALGLREAALMELVAYVKCRPCSQIAADSSLPMEGVVARPAVELKNRRGGRVIVKIKARDFA